MASFNRYENNYNRIYNKLSEDRTTAFNSTSAANEEISNLRKLIFVMWEILKEKGFTDEEFNRSCAKVEKLMKFRKAELETPVYCPKCNKLMRRADSIKRSCPYCENEIYMHDFTIYNAIVDGEIDPDVELDAYEPSPEMQAQEPEEKPYDLDADLRFDDL